MIERLNFYDLYGYLLPGLTWLGLMWLPFGLVWQHWPPAEWSSALVALVLGYIAGHLLQGLAIKAFPSKRKDSNGEFRHPSDLLLDDQDDILSAEVKSRLVNRVLIQFDIDVSNAGNPNHKIREKRRYDAFMLCRRTLMQKGIGSYAEQFEGMYALMRGVMAACVLSATYHLGWALARLLSTSLSDLLPYMSLIGLFVVLLAYKTTKVFWLISALLLLLGCLFGSTQVISLRSFFLLLAICFTSLFVSLRFYDAYHEFSRNFAATVYRDFCAL